MKPYGESPCRRMVARWSQAKRWRWWDFDVRGRKDKAYRVAARREGRKEAQP